MKPNLYVLDHLVLRTWYYVHSYFFKVAKMVSVFEFEYHRFVCVDFCKESIMYVCLDDFICQNSDEKSDKLAYSHDMILTLRLILDTV